VSAERVHRAVEQMSEGPTAGALETLWQETARGHFLIWLPLTHSYEHVGQADLVSGFLGLSGRY
jgi:hypothetical protein